MKMSFDQGGSPWVECGACGSPTRLQETTPGVEATGRRYPLTVLCLPPPPRVAGSARIPKRLFIPEVVKHDAVCSVCSLDLALGHLPRRRVAGGLTLQVEDRRPRLVKKGTSR